MGSGITIDKRTTSLQDWFEIHRHLDSIDFDRTIQNHLVLWKFLPEDSQNVEVVCMPAQIDIYSPDSVFVPQEVYIVLAIKNNPSIVDPDAPATLSSFLYSIQQNIQEVTYSTEIAQGKCGDAAYSVYVYFGKFSGNRLRILALAYALKLHESLSDGDASQDILERKLSILSNGGFIKNKKLQKGSTSVLCKDQPAGNRDLFKFQRIGLLKFFLEPVLRKLTIFAYKPRAVVPRVKKSLSVNSAVSNQQSQPSQNQSLNSGPPKIPGIKPPMLKLTLKPYEEVTYEQISDEQQNGIKFDIRATTRHELKMQKFQKECNQVVEGLFVSGEKAAKDIQTLRKHDITQVINCAGDYCLNWQEDKGINYLTFFLKDSPNENIECLFYRAIQFIQTAHKNNKKVLVHCIQGISRSVTICIAFIMFTHGLDYKKAEALVKAKRGIACPNNGFMVELIQFHKRLYDQISVMPLPRVFLVSSHSKETPSIITARMVKQPLFDPRKYIGLDARTVYLVQTEGAIYIWVGSKCEEGRLKKYWSYAQEYAKKLQRYERAPQQVKGISQGSEGHDFFSIWGLEEGPPLYENQDYNRLFQQGEAAKPGNLRKYYERQEEKAVSKRLFIYPDHENGLGVFDVDDLGGLCILVNNEDENLNVYLCRDEDYGITQDQESEFLDRVIKDHYSSCDMETIVILEENSPEYSEGFMLNFS